MSSDQDVFGDTLRTFRKRRVEPEWEQLDTPSRARYAALFAELHELGVSGLSLSEEQGGLSLDAASRFEVLRQLGASLPALAFGLVSHATALSLICEAAGQGALPIVQEIESGARFGLVGSPLDRSPTTPFSLISNGSLRLYGKQRVALAFAELLLIPALEGTQLRLCIVRADQPGVSFVAAASGHGLCLVPVAELTLDGVALTQQQVLTFPSSGKAAREADGLITALLTGMLDELADRAMGYALERYQGGKMIHEHDAVRALVGPIQLGRRVLESLSLSTLSTNGPADGGASAFGIELVRQAGLDAIQTFGGWGYMEDYRVERYLRDANTLETCWIHAAARTREVAKNRFAELAR